MNLPVFSVVTEFQQRLLIVRLGPGAPGSVYQVDRVPAKNPVG